MKFIIAAAALLLGVLSTIPSANAVVCADGVYRAGCVGPYGAVGVRKGYYGYHGGGYYGGYRGGAVYRGPHGAAVRGPYGGGAAAVRGPRGGVAVGRRY